MNTLEHFRKINFSEISENFHQHFEVLQYRKIFHTHMENFGIRKDARNPEIFDFPSGNFLTIPLYDAKLGSHQF